MLVASRWSKVVRSEPSGQIAPEDRTRDALTSAREGLPPIMSIQGDADPIVPYSNSTRLPDALAGAILHSAASLSSVIPAPIHRESRASGCTNRRGVKHLPHRKFSLQTARVARSWFMPKRGNIFQ
jgi:hypothetical protein